MRHGLTVESIRAYHRESYRRQKERKGTMTTTKKEHILIRMLIEGHSIESAAANMVISYQAAKNYLARARLKTNMTTYQLVARIAVDDYKRGLMMQSAPSEGVPRN